MTQNKITVVNLEGLFKNLEKASQVKKINIHMEFLCVGSVCNGNVLHCTLASGKKNVLVSGQLYPLQKEVHIDEFVVGGADEGEDG
jgi:hypothetical protein